MTCNVGGLSRPSAIITNSYNADVIACVKNIVDTAAKTTNRTDKKELYDGAFELLVKNPKCGIAGVNSEENILLFSLLNKYAQHIFYMQVKGDDTQWGYKQCVKLSTASLGLQLQILTGKEFVDLSSLTSVDELLTRSCSVLENIRPILELFQDRFNTQLSSHCTSMEWRENVALAIQRLAFSLQNISAYKEPTLANQMLHMILNGAAIAIMEPLPDPEILFDFEYNRAVFTINLFDPTDFETKLNLLDKVLIKYKNHYPETSYQYGTKLAQVLNMKGRVLDDIHPALSAEFIAKAYDVRVNLTPPDDLELRKSHFFLLNNIHTGQINNFVMKVLSEPTSAESLRKEYLKDILPKVLMMKAFVEHSAADASDNEYFKGYRALIEACRVSIDIPLEITDSEINAASLKLVGKVLY